MASRDPEQEGGAAAGGEAAALVDEVDGIPCSKVQVIPEDADSYAICLRDAYLHYGSGKKKVPVLIGLDMTIPRGAIYGLLGPSGCGKTTLLSCIVGKQRLRSGRVTVFGGKPGTKRSGVPGSRVGYMPQELALYGEFTIAETLSYFGRIFDMPRDKIRARTKFLLKFLDLPTQQRLIMNLSGGQQRRASLAAALLHEPELLILDEPTVGVDPLLRTSIWKHLLDICSQAETTIVITTHYIEEARQANVVGMMRFGRLLAEGSPADLLDRYSMPNLEDVFLNLCLSDDVDEEGKQKSPEKGEHDCKVVTVSPSKDRKQSTVSNRSNVSNAKSGKGSNTFVKWHRLSALLVKGFIRMWRNLAFLLFQFFIPTLQVTLFCLAIGRNPAGMTVAVVNDELGNGTACTNFTMGCLLGEKESDLWGEDTGWNFAETHKANLSCRYLSYIEADVMKPVYFDDLDSAMETVRKGQHWGVLHFKENFTSAIYDRMFGLAELKIPSEDTLDRSEVHAWLDMTNQQVGYTIQLRLAEAYQAFSKGLLGACELPEDIANIPVAFEEPIYGSNSPTFTEFMAPGVILSITYFMAVGMTSLAFVLERKEGLLDRSWVAGVTATEVMVSHVVCQFVVMLAQVCLVLVFMIYVFEVPARGPMVWIVTLTLMQGICGMAFGLVISALCDNEQDAIQLALGSFYPNLLLSGIIWPLEGMPQVLRYLSYILPQTFACEAMRGILSRGWGLGWMQVYRGFLVTSCWIAVMLVLSAVILKVRR